jgi:uncharacterized protein YjbJ (UPF0337 family)
MNEDILKGNWKQIRGKVKETWGRLTDDELDEIDGRMDQLIGKLRYAMAIPHGCRTAGPRFCRPPGKGILLREDCPNFPVCIMDERRNKHARNYPVDPLGAVVAGCTASLAIQPQLGLQRQWYPGFAGPDINPGIGIRLHIG